MPDDWKRLSFTPDQMISGALSRLGYTFTSRYLQHRMPKGAAILDNSDPVDVMNIPSSIITTSVRRRQSCPTLSGTMTLNRATSRL